MRIVLAPDSFKGSLSSPQVCNALAEGLLSVIPNADVIKMPMADGGEGTVEALVAATGGEVVGATVTDPLGRPVEAFFGILGDKKTAVIEMAAASGLPLISKVECDPLRATTYGTGELLKAALDRGCRKVFMGIGGSATNDGGAGMAQALGFRLLDESGGEIGPGGLGLERLSQIGIGTEDPRLHETEVVVACDVDNVLCGSNGASRIYGPQKGATEEMVQQLDLALQRYALTVKRDLGVDILDIPGSGAAGGLGGGAVAFLGAELKRGIDIVMEVSGFEQHIELADLVITGEGKMDSQTLSGKTPLGVARVAKKHNVPVVGIAGWVDEGIGKLREHGFDTVLGICSRPMTLEEAMDSAYECIVATGVRIASLLRLGASMPIW